MKIESIRLKNYKVFRAGLTVRPTESIENYLLVNYYQSDDNNNPLGVASLINPTGATRAMSSAPQTFSEDSSFCAVWLSA